MAYTSEQLAIVCPKCHAAKGGNCLEQKLSGSYWIGEPHPERVREAEEKKNVDAIARETVG